MTCPASSPAISHMPCLSLSSAQSALEACLQQAQTSKVPVNISIYDSSLHLVSFARMPTAKLTSISIAHNKAITAAGHRNPTDWYGSKSAPGGPLWGIENSNEGKFCTIMGGEPIIVDGVCIGGIGVSGGLPSQDKVRLLLRANIRKAVASVIDRVQAHVCYRRLLWLESRRLWD